MKGSGWMIRCGRALWGHCKDLRFWVRWEPCRVLSRRMCLTSFKSILNGNRLQGQDQSQEALQ